MDGAVAVLDIGKTNVKLASFAPDGALLWERATPNRVLPGPPYPHADVEAIGAFLLAALAEANRAAPVAAIVTTTHGCAGALIDKSGLVLPVLDYEFAGVDEIEPAYAPLRPPFANPSRRSCPPARISAANSPGRSSASPANSRARGMSCPIRNIGPGGSAASRRRRSPRSARIPISGRRAPGARRGSSRRSASKR